MLYIIMYVCKSNNSRWKYVVIKEIRRRQTLHPCNISKEKNILEKCLKTLVKVVVKTHLKCICIVWIFFSFLVATDHLQCIFCSFLLFQGIILLMIEEKVNDKWRLINLGITMRLSTLWTPSVILKSVNNCARWRILQIILNNLSNKYFYQDESQCVAWTYTTADNFDYQVG